MSGQLLFEFLDRQRASYIRQPHRVAYTAAEIAEIGHINGRNFAKVVMIKVDGELAMMVLPAHYLVEPASLKSALGASRLELATEREFSYRFPRCELGAMPPFGHLFGFQTFMASVFNQCDEIAFNAGTHTELIRMSVKDYLRFACVIEVFDGVIPPSISSPKALRAGTGSRL